MKSTLCHTRLHPYVPDIVTEILRSKDRLGYWANPIIPRSFNEWVIHRKFATNRPLYTKLSDKWAVREYVNQQVGSEILTEVYHVTDDPETIPFADLPAEFVIKPTHSWNRVRLIDENEPVDRDSLRESCNQWLSETHGDDTNEYWYPDIDPRIIVEERLHGPDGQPPHDYKFYVFNGEVAYLHVITDRFGEKTRRFYTPDWTPLDIQKGGAPLGDPLPRPSQLDEMKDIAEDLGDGLDFVRVDLYQDANNNVKFGELTFAPDAGYGGFDPVRFDFEMGSYWTSVALNKP